MKKEIYYSPYRNYRSEIIQNADEQKIQIIAEESDLLITISSQWNKKEAISFCTQKLQETRSILKFWINLYPEIQHSLDPILCPANAPAEIAIMCSAAQFANVGPFAAIAGTIAQIIATHIHSHLKNKNLPSDVIVENGGDIYCFSSKNRIIGILANPQEHCTIGLNIKKEQFPLAICSSSSTIGHSLSFGNGELALITAKNASLADALATRYCNLLKSKYDLNTILEQAKNDSLIKIDDNPFNCSMKKNGLTGVFLQIDETIGAWGDIELTAIKQ